MDKQNNGFALFLVQTLLFTLLSVLHVPPWNGNAHVENKLSTVACGTNALLQIRETHTMMR